MKAIITAVGAVDNAAVGIAITWLFHCDIVITADNAKLPFGF